MGLDIMHYKLTYEPKEAEDYLFLGDWDLDCNVPLAHYAKYITDVKSFEYHNNLLIIANKDALEKLEKDEFYNIDAYAKILFGGFDDALIKQDIAHFMKQNNLEVSAMRALDFECEGVFYTTVSFAEETTVKGMYYKEVGYQRKGMNAHFYKTFKKNTFWGKQEDFELAYNCIGGDWYLEHWGEASVENMKKQFKKDFVECFEFGKSLLCASF